MISVICIDPELWFYDLFQKIAADRDIKVIGEASMGEKGFELVRQHQNKSPLFVLINAELPDMSGEIVCRRIHRHWPEIHCVFLMNHVHWPTLSRLVNTPAKGFLTKDACYLTLEAVKVINAGKTYLQPDLALKLIHYRENPQINSLNKLSSREYEVLAMLSKNKSYEEIAKLIHLHIRTVYNLRGSAFKKLGLSSYEQMRELMSQKSSDKHSQ